MRFEGSYVVAAPPRFVLRALREPAVLEASIPHCTRIEAQPGYRPEQGDEAILGFEIGTANPANGAEPIVGWIELAALTLGTGLNYTLTLDDGVTRIRAHGAVRLHGRDHERQTELRYTLEAGVAGQQTGAWSPSAIVVAERTIAHFLAAFAALAGKDDLTLAREGNGQSAAAEARRSGTAQVLVETRRGQVLLLPAHPVPSPTQGMLRRLRDVEQVRTRQTTLWWSLAGLALVVGSVAAWQGVRRIRRRA